MTDMVRVDVIRLRMKRMMIETPAEESALTEGEALASTPATVREMRSIVTFLNAC